MKQNKNRKACTTCYTCNTFYTFGFTLIELIISIAILAVLFAITTINISPLPSNTLQSTNLDTLLSDIRSQQTWSMSDDSFYGIYFGTDSYTLFKGNVFTEGISTNTVINLDPGIIFSNVTFPNSTVIFSPGSGDITNYITGQDSFALTSLTTNKSTVIKINKYGATY